MNPTDETATQSPQPVAPLNPSEETATQSPQPSDQPATVGRVELPSTTGYRPPAQKNGPLIVPGFEIESELGRGGMGVVYLARQTGLNRTVALKVILNIQQATAGDLVRFLAEAEAVAKLDHPHIVQVYQSGTTESVPYFALEYLDGGTLSDLIRDNPLEPKRAAELVERLAEAMAYSHAQGIVHRDLKPSNVLMTRDGIPKVADFGLAKRLDAGAGMTVTGQIMGTPSYMAPEQARGENDRVNPSTDVYALGAILYNLLTGRPPFLGPTSHATMKQVIESDPISPSELQSGVPRDLETICLKCLRKEQSDRYRSAKALAADLRAFLEGRGISARPMGRIEKATRWVKRNPSVSLLLALFVLTLVGGAAFSFYYAGKAKEAADAERDKSAKLEAQQRRRALAQVETLLTADPRAVPTVLKSLAEDLDEVLERLKEVWAHPLFEKDRLRAGLALLPVDTESVRPVLLDGMLSVKDPAELMAIRNALKPFMDSRSAPLWQKLEESPERRLQVLAALAAFDHNNPKWQSVGDLILQPWLSDNPLYLGDWTDALRPVRLRLIPSLKKVYSGEVLPELKYVAANILGDYESDQPEVLVSLIQSGDDRQFNTLFPVLEKHRAKAVELFRAALKQQPEAKWGDLPLDPKWVAPSMETLAEVEKAQGMIAERFAFVQSLPLSRLKPLAESLVKSGYRPRRVRPYRQGEDWKTTVVWLRDGKGFRLKSALTEEEAKGENARQAKEQFLPLDAAAYRDGGAFRFVVLWEQVQQAERRELFLALSNLEYEQRWPKLRDDNLWAVGKQVLGIGKGEWRFTEVWQAGGPVWSGNWGLGAAEIGNLLGNPSTTPADLGYSPWLEPEWIGIGSTTLGFSPWSLLTNFASGADLKKSQYSLLFQSRPFETEVLVGLDAMKHAERCREFAAQGYRPSSVASDGAEFASVWERPWIRDEQREAVAKTVSDSVMGLTRLGDGEPVWPLLQFSPQPEARTRSVLRFAETGTPVGVLIERLKVEKDTGVRQGLILALGRYAESQVSKEQRQEVIDLLLKWYRDDPDSGIHGAIDWLLRPTQDGPQPRKLAWGQAKALAEIDAALAGKAGAGKDRAWYVNGQGQTYAVLDSREPFLMSSPSWEKDRFSYNEVQHWRKLDRKYAVATKPVTVGQFERFKQANPEISHSYTQVRAPEADCPAIMVTWYEAIAYCRWLSEEEGLGEDEMVYPKVSEIVKAAKEDKPLALPKDYLKRMGYRLLTEPEWEYAARAGTLSPYHYGASVELLREYGWYKKNTNEERTWPVGEKMPNGFGLFDMSGNAHCWTQGRLWRYPSGNRDKAEGDLEDKQSITNNNTLVLRGGSFRAYASELRSSNRTVDVVRLGNYNGFRPSRTFD